MDNSVIGNLDIESFFDSFAAEIKNINLSSELPNPEITQIKQAFDQFGILIFRDQNSCL